VFRSETLLDVVAALVKEEIAERAYAHTIDLGDVPLASL
jgi:hypothetical protein